MPVLPVDHTPINTVAPTRVTSVYLNFPTTYQITNYHIWFTFCADFLFREHRFRPDFVMSAQTEWKKYSLVLHYLYNYTNNFPSYKELFKEVMDNSDSVDDLIDYGQSLNDQFKDISLKIQTDVDEFFEITGFDCVDSKNEKEFNDWYNSRFEPTSHVHRTAYSLMARRKQTFAGISILLLMIPSDVNALAVKSTRPSHKHIWVFDMRDGEVKCNCGEVKDIVDEYDNLSGIY